MSDTAARAEALFRQDLAENHRQCDRSFAWLMVAQWLLGLVIALVFSPHAWSGKVYTTHLHVYYTVIVGGALSGSVVLMAWLRPGATVTRHTAAAAQMLWSALLIHLTGGRIESHFHVFGSLAFLAFYRDRRLLVTATAVVVVDHVLRGLYWSESVYGTTNPEWWRFLEHGAWVLFENAVLWVAIHKQLHNAHTLALRQAELEAINAGFERGVKDRTRELEQSWEQFRSLVATTHSVPWQFDQRARRYTMVGPEAWRLLGCTVTSQRGGDGLMS